MLAARPKAQAARIDWSPPQATVFADRIESLDSLWAALRQRLSEWRVVAIAVDPQGRIGLQYSVRVTEVYGGLRWQVIDEVGVTHSLESLADHAITRAIARGRAWLDNREPCPPQPAAGRDAILRRAA
jgi:hypothetical protein